MHQLEPQRFFVSRVLSWWFIGTQKMPWFLANYQISNYRISELADCQVWKFLYPQGRKTLKNWPMGEKSCPPNDRRPAGGKGFFPRANFKGFTTRRMKKFSYLTTAAHSEIVFLYELTKQYSYFICCDLGDMESWYFPVYCLFCLKKSEILIEKQNLIFYTKLLNLEILIGSCFPYNLVFVLTMSSLEYFCQEIILHAKSSRNGLSYHKNHY